MGVDGDRYAIPGSGGVLRNKLDLGHLCSINRRLFSTVLERAGELRYPDVDVAVGGTRILCARGGLYRAGLDDMLGQLQREDYPRGRRSPERSQMCRRWTATMMPRRRTPLRDDT